MNGKRLLADILVWEEGEVEEAFLFKNSYSLMKKRKKDGSLRVIYVPNPELKRFQRRFLKYFLYRIPLDDHLVIQGFRPKVSYVDNARSHASEGTKFVLRLDLRDAFPSVKTEYLKSVLKKILSSEIKKYASVGECWVSGRPLFPVKKVRWFRSLVKDIQLDLFHDYPSPLRVIDEFNELVLSLVTYKGELPQGAPTSPYLLNIVLYYSGLVEKVYQFLWDKEILISDDFVSEVAFSIYADDFTISSSKPISGTLINGLINLIEQESPFKVNRRKIFYFRRDRTAPLVTGLRLVRLVKNAEELKTDLSKLDLNWREKKNLMEKMLNKKGEWIVDSVSLPKKEIRKIRGLINMARYPLFRETLGKKVDGYIACLKAIYGSKLPKQIATPYQKYLSSLGSRKE